MPKINHSYKSLLGESREETGVSNAKELEQVTQQLHDVRKYLEVLSVATALEGAGIDIQFSIKNGYIEVKQ